MSKLKGIYLGACLANHPNYNIIYQDINNKRDIGGDMLDIDLSLYDYIIATPPCNYWSRCNYRRNTSFYALSTRCLLPMIVDKLIHLGKPFIVENVRNDKLFNEFGLLDKNCYIFKRGRHTYWTNISFDFELATQRQDFLNGGYVILYDDMKGTAHQGGFNVHNVIELFLKELHSRYE